MSHVATVWAISQKLPALQKLVLILLADRHNKDTGRCFPSMARVADDAGMSKRAVQNAIYALEQSGHVTAIRRKDGDVNLSNAYQLNVESGVVTQEMRYPDAPPAGGVTHEVRANQETKPVSEPDTPSRLFEDAPPTSPKPKRKSGNPPGDWQTIVDAIDSAYIMANNVKCPWNPLAFGRLRKELDAHPRWGPDEWLRCIANRFASKGKVNLGEAPASFVLRLKDFIGGPLNKFGSTGGDDGTNSSNRNRGSERIDQAADELRKAGVEVPFRRPQTGSPEVQPTQGRSDGRDEAGVILEGDRGGIPRR